MVESGGSESRRSGVVGNVFGLVAPAVLRQIDTNDLVEALDVDTLVQQVDVDAVARRLDLDALLERIDVDALAQRLDLDALVERLDVDAIAQRLDVDALVQRIDVDAIAQRLDLEAVVGRVDVARITAGAGQDVAVSGLDLVRRQFVRADATVEAVSDRLLRRAPGTRPDAPGELAASEVVSTEAVPADPHRLERRDVSGHYSGPVTRLAAVAADAFGVFTLGTTLASVLLFLLGQITDTDPSAVATGVTTLVAVTALFLTWFWLPVALFGRTPAMALLGVAVVRRDGGVAGSTRALVRALVLPVSMVVPILFLSAVLGRERRTLHDLVAGTAVVYDWGAREAEQPATVRQQLSARVRRSQVERAAG